MNHITRLSFRNTLCLTFLLLALMLTGFVQTAIADPDDDGWISLFNGKDLSGWYTFLDQHGKNNDPDRIFTVEDGVIHLYKYAEDGASTPLGYFCTETEYSHYHLRFQYKWGSKRFGSRSQRKRDSGLMYHCVGPDGVLAKTWPRCVELQVQEGDTGDALCLAGARYAVNIDPNARGLPSHIEGRYLSADEGGVPYTAKLWIAHGNVRDELSRWNTVELIVAGSDYAVHMVNGRANNRLTRLEQQGPDGQWIPLAGGRFLLQAELAEVFYRNIEIKPIRTGPFRPKGSPLIADADGVLWLYARDAALSGKSLRFQPDEHQTLGHWHYPDDTATWTVDVPKAGKYNFELEWSINDNAAINTFQVAAENSSFQAKVLGTGGWWTYKKKVFGQLDLDVGVQEVSVKPIGEFAGALMDIRAARLLPMD